VNHLLFTISFKYDDLVPYCKGCSAEYYQAFRYMWYDNTKRLVIVCRRWMSQEALETLKSTENVSALCGN